MLELDHAADRAPRHSVQRQGGRRRHGLSKSVKRTPRFTIPMPRNTTIKRILSCRLQLGHLPSKRQDTGLPPPPTIPLRKPYTFRSPTVVKVTPTTAGGNQSGSAIIILPPTAR